MMTRSMPISGSTMGLRFKLGQTLSQTMNRMGLWAFWGALHCVFATFVSLISPSAALAAKIEEKTEVRDYRVYGTTPGQLVSYMKRRPFRGDNGPAMANIRPRYKLKTATAKSPKGCKVKRVHLSIRFIMTLPRSMEARKQDRKTKYAWRSFRAFARRHEERHRQIYLSCARRFVRQATRLAPQRQCRTLTRQVKKLLKEQEKACDRKHLAFDRRDFPRVPSLPLFRHARFEKTLNSRARHRASRTSTRTPRMRRAARR